MARDRASRPQAKPLRLFVAADIPDDVRGDLVQAIAPLRERFLKARWVPPENLHVTLKFLGRTWPRLLDWVRESVGSVAASHAPVESALVELGSFPSSRRARVLWAGLDDAKGSVAAMASDLDEALSKEFEPEKRAFAAHLTVARSDPPIALGDELGAIDVPTRAFTIDRVVLYRSHLQRPAPRYEALEEFRLGE